MKLPAVTHGKGITTAVAYYCSWPLLDQPPRDRQKSEVALTSTVRSRRWHDVPSTGPPAVWQYISVDNAHCVHSARSCINFAYNFQNLYNDIKNKNETLWKGGGCNIITNLHPCKTHPFLLCTDMCGWSTFLNISLLFSHCSTLCRSYPGC
jgi:hypothetical protein